MGPPPVADSSLAFRGEDGAGSEDPLKQATAPPPKKESTRQDRRRAAEKKAMQQAAQAHSSNLEMSALLAAAREHPCLADLNLDFPLAEAVVPRTASSSNSFMGLRNMAQTCFANASVQVFLHVAALRQWISAPGEYRRVQAALSPILRHHDEGKLDVLAPIGFLKCLFENTQQFPVASYRCDALECFKWLHEGLRIPDSEECQFLRESFQYPSCLPDGGSVEVRELLHGIVSDKGAMLESPPGALILSVLRY